MDDKESIATEELGNFGEIETKLKSNGSHVEDVNGKLLEDIKVGGPVGMPPEVMGSMSLAIDKRQGLKKWRRIPRELVKKAGSNFDGRKNGDLIVDIGEIEQGSNGSMMNVNGNFSVSNVLYDYFGSDHRPVCGTREDSTNSEDHSSRSSTAASAPRMGLEISSLNGRNSAGSILPDNQQRNGQYGTSKKARGFKIEKENSHSSMGSDYQSSNFVFVQGSNSVASKGSQSGGFLKYDEEYSDDAHHADKLFNEEVQTAFLKNDAESEEVSQDVAAENSWEVKEENIGKHEGSMNQDALGESVTGLQSALEELAGEVQKWKDLGKDDQLIFDASTRDMLELKDARISELESTLISEHAKTELEDLLKEIIQANVEFVVLSTTTRSLTEGPLHELEHSLQQKYVPSQEDIQVPKEQPQKLETTEYVKKLQNRVGRFTSFLIIQSILLLVTSYLKFSSHNAEIVPT